METLLELSVPVEALLKGDILQGADGSDLVVQNDAEINADYPNDPIGIFFANGWNAFPKGTMINILRLV